MYSLVLMSAMSTAPNTADFNGYFRDLFNRNGCSGCTGCDGCSGAAKYSCSGGGCCGSNSASCNGCCGGSGLFSGERIRSFFNPTNCTGCCGGSAAYASGCCGGSMAYASGCCGGSMAYSNFSMPVQSYTPMFNGGLSCYGGPVVTTPVPAYESYPAMPGFNVPPPMSIPYAPPEVAPPSAIERTGFGPRPPATVTSASNMANRATVIVRLPADAMLLADGTALKMTGTERKFMTPELPAGMEFTYKFTAEYERNGDVVSVSKKVVVRPGSMAMVEFADLTATKPAPMNSDAPVSKEAVAAAPVSFPKTAVAPIAPVAAPVQPAPQQAQPAQITVKLPLGATLYVDDRKNASTDLVRKFTTPPLPAGREFGYLLKVEVVRNGTPETLTQKVAFRAGEQVTVDMSSVGR